MGLWPAFADIAEPVRGVRRARRGHRCWHGVRCRERSARRRSPTASPIAPCAAACWSCVARAPGITLAGAGSRGGPAAPGRCRGRRPWTTAASCARRWSSAPMAAARWCASSPASAPGAGAIRRLRSPSPCACSGRTMAACTSSCARPGRSRCCRSAPSCARSPGSRAAPSRTGCCVWTRKACCSSCRTASRSTSRERGVCGRPTGHPLSGLQAVRYGAPRVALVGDAAHGLHPIHAQGFNLAVRDVAALAEVVVDSLRAGADPGGAGRSAALRSPAAHRCLADGRPDRRPEPAVLHRPRARPGCCAAWALRRSTGCRPEAAGDAARHGARGRSAKACPRRVSIGWVSAGPRPPRARCSAPRPPPRSPAGRCRG